jgi:hypothetical protein
LHTKLVGCGGGLTTVVCTYGMYNLRWWICQSISVCLLGSSPTVLIDGLRLDGQTDVGFLFLFPKHKKINKKLVHERYENLQIKYNKLCSYNKSLSFLS